jgi:Carboxypeptidase regulatory-like domain
MFSKIQTACLLGMLLTFAGSAFGQGGANGTILGTVTDNSGAVVVNATVDVTNTATNVTNHTQTTSSGDFTVPYLQPGTYKVTIQAPGFQKAVTDSITLVVGQQQRVNVSMKSRQAA